MIRFLVVLAVGTVVAYYVGRLTRVARESPELLGAPKQGAFWRRAVYALAVVCVLVFFLVLYGFLELVYFSAWGSIPVGR